MTEHDRFAERGRQASKEIEITPEMIEASVEALCSCDDRFSSKPDVERIAVEVFEAMRNVQDLGSA